MGKIKQRKLRVSRYSPTHVNSNGRAKENPSDYPFPSRPYYNTSESSKGTAFPHLSGEELYPMEGETSRSDHFKTTKAKGGLKTAEEKILSETTEERMTGLNMLAAFALESKAAEYIIENKMVASIAPLLRDDSSPVRLAAAGTLRNLCAFGSDDVIDMIVQQDVLHPLSQLLKTYEANVPPPDASKRGCSLTFTKGVANSMDESDPHDLIFIHATNVLWSLCECNEEALSIFNREGLVNILLKHINPFEWNYSVSLAAADCLLCVSENNPKTSSSVLPLADTLHSLVVKSLSDNCDAFGLHFAAVISGVLLNINYWLPGETSFRQVFEVLNKVLEVDATSLFQTRQQESIPKASIQEQLEHIISAQLVAFEILSNICCCPDEEEEWDEYEENDDELEVTTEDSMEIENEKNKHIADSLSAEVLESIKYFHLMEKTHKKIMLPSLGEFGKNEDEKKSISEKFGHLQIRALQCFQNLLSCLQVDDLGGSDSLYSTWLALGQMSFSNLAQTDKNLLEATSGAMRAIIDKLSADECRQLFTLSSNELRVIFTTGLSCEAPSVRANVCRMLGTLGCSVIKHASEDNLSSAESADLLVPLIEFLLQVCQEDAALPVRAEALDVLIDLFSDDKTDRLAARVRLVERLKDIHPQFKAKYNQQKKTLGDHRPLVLTVRDNLAAFIKYKGQRTLKLATLGH